MPRLPAALAAAALLAVLIPAGARADWGAGVPLASPGHARELLALAAADDDRPAVLLQRHSGHHTTISLRTAQSSGRMGAEMAVAAPAHEVQKAQLFAGAHGDLVAGWLEQVDGIDQPVLASGPRLAGRQVLTAPGPREFATVVLRANRRGDAVVVLGRYRLHVGYEVWVASRPAGGRFGAPQLLVMADAESAAVAIDEQGGAAVAWLRNGRAEVAQRPAGATAFGPAVAAGVRPRADSELAIATDRGHVLLGWIAGTHQTQWIQASEQPAAGAPFTPPWTLSDPAMRIPWNSWPAVAIDGHRSLVTWVQGLRREGIGNEQAALAVRDGDRPWKAARIAGVPAPGHVVESGVTAGAPGRPPLLVVMTSRVLRLSGATATVRADGSLSPLRLPRAAADIGSFPFIAQGGAHSWMGVRHITGPPGTYPGEPLLLRS
ncbi:MAG TPA: hypothetical protein VGO71_17820 [Baekduia sp.]|jgi:hypothetical protein|nr:hypothetical protein [Baekduia sp.]